MAVCALQMPNPSYLAQTCQHRRTSYHRLHYHQSIRESPPPRLSVCSACPSSPATSPPPPPSAFVVMVVPLPGSFANISSFPLWLRGNLKPSLEYRNSSLRERHVVVSQPPDTPCSAGSSASQHTGHVLMIDFLWYRLRYIIGPSFVPGPPP